MRKPSFPPLILLALVAATPAPAQAVESVSLRMDNDLFALRGREAPPDYDYTHGLHLAFGLGSAAGLDRRIPYSPCTAPPCARAAIGAGQRIYTPRRDAPIPVPGERPYAAWLFASARVSAAGPRRERTLDVEIGVTGPPALGGPVQNGMHRLLGSRRQEGWDHQLRFEPGVLLRYEEALAFQREIPGVGAARLIPAASVTVGNVRTAAGVGASVRLGGDYLPGVVARLGVRHERVARDLFLDGNTFRDNSLAERLPSVSEGEAGLGYRFRAWTLEYRFVVRTREYRAQPGPHRYGSLSVAWHRE